jgi:transposase-like protein
MVEVELISSGYAWRCPECTRTEYENAVPASGRVRCTRCGASFAVRRVSHRAEGGVLEKQHVALEGQGAVALPSAD